MHKNLDQNMQKLEIMPKIVFWLAIRQIGMKWPEILDIAYKLYNTS